MGLAPPLGNSVCATGWGFKRTPGTPPTEPIFLTFDVVYFYRPQRSCGQGNIFTGVCLSTGGRGGLLPGGVCSWGGVSCPGGCLVPGGLLPGGSASGGVCSWGMSGPRGGSAPPIFFYIFLKKFLKIFF